MQSAILPRLRPPLYVWPLLILGVILSQSTYAQGDPPRQVNLRQEPSNERLGIRKKVSYTWGCYNSLGKWKECQFEQSVEGLKQPETCQFDRDDTTLCNNGGHLHNGSRPLIFDEDNAGKLLYFADQLPGDPRRVKGVTNTPPTFWATTTHELPQVGGRLQAKGQMQFFEGGFGRPRFDRNTKQSEMTVDVRILGMVELPPGPGTYIRCAETSGCISDSPDGSAHFRPFFGRPGLINRLIGFAAAHRAVAEFNDRVLRITDSSLPKGGQFDLGPPLGDFWATPHISHRRGTGADISRFTLLDGTVNTENVDQEVVDDFALKLGFDRGKEVTKQECPQIGTGPPCIHLEL